MFEKKDIGHYVFAFSLIMLASYVGNGFKKNFIAEDNDEYDLIRKYLLNDSPLYGFNKPKIWIHSKYEVNARNWIQAQSRNTTNLNQPYLHLTIQSIIDHCGDDFHVCLIDDNTFSNLIPGWDVDVSTMANPMKTHFRELGLLKLIYMYGGMVVPNSFVCSKNLKGLYNDGITGNRPFVCEAINRTMNVAEQKQKMLFVPDMYFMGALKNDAGIKDMIHYVSAKNNSTHFSSERVFVGNSNQFLILALNDQRFNLIGGEKIGVKTDGRKQILLEDLMAEKSLSLVPDCYGVYIPEDEVLARTKYQWFAVMSKAELLNSNIAIMKYVKASMVDARDEYYKPSIIPSVVSL